MSIASHTAMKMHSKIVLEGSCVRIVLKLFSSLSVHAKFEKAAPVTIDMFDQVKLTTSTKVSSLHLVTTGGVLSSCHIEGQKSGLQQFL